MKSEFFSISNHKAMALLKNKQTGFEWTVSIETTNLIIDKNVIDSFLRANKLQNYAQEGGGLGSWTYKCTYLNPFPYNASFIAGSNGK